MPLFTSKEEIIRRQLFLAFTFFAARTIEMTHSIVDKKLSISQQPADDRVMVFVDEPVPTPIAFDIFLRDLSTRHNIVIEQNEQIASDYVMRFIFSLNGKSEAFKKEQKQQSGCAKHLCCFWTHSSEYVTAKNELAVCLTACEAKLNEDMKQYPELKKVIELHQHDPMIAQLISDTKAHETYKHKDKIELVRSVSQKLHVLYQQATDEKVTEIKLNR